jgi:hypothetical protein
LLVPGASVAEDLTGGRLAIFVDREGTARDRAVVRFVREEAIVAPLPNPTAAVSTLRMWSDTTDTGAVVLAASQWRSSVSPRPFSRFRAPQINRQFA